MHPMNSLLWHQGSKSTFYKHSLNYREFSSSHMLQPFDHQCKILVWLSWDEWMNSARNQTCEMSLGYVYSSWIKSLVIFSWYHYGDVITGAIAFQITSLTIVYSTVYSDADQRKHQSSASLAFVWGIHRGPENVSIWWRHHIAMGIRPLLR